MKKHTFFIIFIISIALLIGIWRDNSTAGDSKPVAPIPPLSAGTAFPQPKEISAFKLKDMEGKTFTNAQLKDRWSFLFFGYTTCPDVCPKTLASMKEIAQRLHGGAMVQFLFVTLNPQYDNASQLKSFLQQPQYSSVSFMGLTGKKDNIYALAQELNVHIAQVKDIEHLEHSSAILLINPQGKLAAVFTGSDRPHAVSHDFKEIVHYYARA